MMTKQQRLRVLLSLSLLSLPQLEAFQPLVVVRAWTTPETAKESSFALLSEQHLGNDIETDYDSVKDGEEVTSLAESEINIPDETQKESEDDSSSLQQQKKPFSMVQWKKKRFLMMNDVTSRIHHNDRHAVRKAEEMIRRMKRMHEKVPDHDCGPTVQAYNLWINALAKSGQADAGQRAEQVLEEMRDVGLAPNVISYTFVMKAYARQSKQQDPKAAAHAERILFDLIRESGMDKELTATSITCDTVINAWAHQGSREGAERAEDILVQLELWNNAKIRPTEHSYANVIHAWASCKCGGEGALRAESILKRMLRRNMGKENDTMIRPDTVIFNAVIHAWATSGDSQAGTRAVELLNKMEELHEKKGYDCSPDVITYNTVLSAWSHSMHINAATQAEKILQEMLIAHRQAPETAPAPVTTSYNNVLHAWSRSKLEGATKRAENVLEYMIRSKQPGIAPDVYSFSSVLSAIARSRDPDKAVHARALLDTLLERYESTRDPSLKPSQVPFNTVLNAAAFSSSGTTDQQQRDALQVAVQTFTLMREKGVTPDAVTYGNVIKCFADLMPPGQLRSDMSLQLFQKCCNEGRVGDFVWNEVRRAVPAKTLTQELDLVGSIRSMQIRDLPRAWRRNVKGDKPPQKRKTPRERSAEEPPTTPQRAPVRRVWNISEQSYQSDRDI